MELKDRTKIIFHNGLRTIGGTLIEIIYKDSRIFFDFGSSYDPTLLKQPNSFIELLESNSISNIDGLYDKRLYPNNDIKKSKYKNEGMFISHGHLDHSKLINFLNPNIPVYSSIKTKLLVETLNSKNDFLFPFEKSQNSNSFTRDITGVRTGELIKIGEIMVKFVPVDHDIYGSCGLIITTPSGKISYSGDLRLHGFRKEDTFSYCLESEDSDILIIEGVSVSNYEVGSIEEELKKTSEKELIETIIEIIKENKDTQITFNYYISNIERIYHLINELKFFREVVLEQFYAFVLKKLTGLEVRYYKLDDLDLNLDKSLEIGIDELLMDKGSFLWQLDTGALKYMDHMKENGIYIHSNAAPLGSYDPNYDPFLQKFSDKNIEVKIVSCSGHAYTQDLMRIINWIRPKTLCPVHSFHPERLYNLYGERVLPEKGKVLELLNKEENKK